MMEVACFIYPIECWFENNTLQIPFLQSCSPEAYLRPYQTSKTERFEVLVNGILDIWQASQCASVAQFQYR